MNLVTFPTIYAPDPDTNEPVSMGTVYIGEPDTDPRIELNRVTVTIKQEDGNEVPIAPDEQPLTLGQGGVFMYQGSPVQIYVSGNYSMTVLRDNDSQAYYFPDAGVPDIIVDIQDSSFTYVFDISGTNIITGDTDPELGDYVVGQLFHFIPLNTNTGSATFNVSGLGAGAVLLGGNPLIGGEIVADVPVQLMVTSTVPTFEIIGNGAFIVFDDALESGTRAPFIQNSAPADWTFVSGLGDMVILNTATESEGGDTGGSWTISGLEAEAHVHEVDISGTTGNPNNFDTADAGANIPLASNPHGHAFDVEGDTELSTALAVSSDGDWRPAYVKSIICEKD